LTSLLSLLLTQVLGHLLPAACCFQYPRGDILPTPTDLINTVRDIVKESGLTLIIEPGRSMVATSSALVNTVTGGSAQRVVMLQSAQAGI
jgi:diaminopimelate decarboxylase